MLDKRRIGMWIAGAIVLATACSGGETKTFDNASCNLDGWLNVSSNDGIVPCTPDLTRCSVSYRTERFSGGRVLVTAEGEKYRVEMAFSPDIDPGNTSHSFTYVHNYSHDDIESAPDPDEEELYLSIETPSKSEHQECAEEIDEPGLDTDFQIGSDPFDDVSNSRIARIHDFEVDTAADYFRMDFGTGGHPLFHDSSPWRSLRASLEIQAGQPLGGGGGSGAVDCDAQCQREHDLCGEEGGMIGCYCGAACLCQCALDTGNYTGEDAEEYQSCVEENRDNAELIEDEEGSPLTSGTQSGDTHVCDMIDEL